MSGMPNWLINFFAGLGILESTLLIIGGVIVYLDVKRADQED